jgi:hypothetical protein
MVWKNHAISLEDAKKQFSDAREAYLKAKAGPLTNPNYCLEVDEAEEKMKLQFQELEAWKKKKPMTLDLIGQLQKNALGHEDPKIRANCQNAIQYIAAEILKTKPQSFQDAVKIVTELKMLQLMNLGKTWEEIEANVDSPKHLALIMVRKFMVRMYDKIKEDEPDFEMNQAVELALIEKYMEVAPELKEILLGVTSGS